VSRILIPISRLNSSGFFLINLAPEKPMDYLVLEFNKEFEQGFTLFNPFRWFLLSVVEAGAKKAGLAAKYFFSKK